MQSSLSNGIKKARNVYNQWGGNPAALFATTHGSHDQAGGLLVALLPFIRMDLSLTYLQSGLLLSAYSITSGASQFLGGWLGDRTSRYRVIAIGLFGIGASALAISFTSSFSSMLVIYVIMGVFAGAYHPSAASLISARFDEKRGKAIAFHMLGGSVGFAMGPILGAIIASAMGWRSAYLILCIPALLSVLISLKIFRRWENLGSEEPVPDLSITDEKPVTSLPTRLNILQVLKPIAIITVLAIIIQLVAGSATAFIPLYLVDKHAITPAYAVLLVGVIRVGGMGGSLFGGWLSDKWGRRNSIGLAFAATGPLLYLLTQLPMGVAVMIVFFIFGMSMQMRQSTVQPYLMDNTPHYLRATVFGIYFGLGIEGQSLLQPVVGYLVDSFGVIDIFQLIAFISIGLSAVALLLFRKPKSAVLAG